MGNKIVLRIVVGLTVLVIGGLILAAILESGNPITQMWSWIWSGVSWAWEMLISSHPIPGWVILAVGILALIGLVFVAILLSVLLQEAKVHQHQNYTEDTIDGVIWRWRWEGNRIDNLWCFCPTCDSQLVNSGGFSETRYICERCPSDGSVGGIGSRGRAILTVPGDWQYGVVAAKREIERRIRIRERQVSNR